MTTVIDKESLASNLPEKERGDVGNTSSGLRRYIGRLLAPFSRQISFTRSAAQLTTRSPRYGPGLLFKSWLAPRPESQPDVYAFAAFLAERFGCTHVVTIGKPTAKNLLALYPQFEIVGLVPGADLTRYRNQYGFGTWLEENITQVETSALSQDVLQRAIIICQNLEQFASPVSLLRDLKSWLEHAPLCILTSLDRELSEAGADCPAATATPSRKWNLKELGQLLRAEGFNLEFIGLTASDDAAYEKKTILAVVTRDAGRETLPVAAPPEFRVVAFMAAYNEEDIIVESIKKWTDQGVRVHVLENWSTDSTFHLAKELANRLPITVERFPRDGPSEYFDWSAMLGRMEELSREIEADWFVRRGADEVLTTPWPGVSYRDGLYLVDQAGFNCVDHTIVEFHPVDDAFAMGMDHEAYFKHFDFKNLSHPKQRKAWKNSGQVISTVPSAGHDVVFDGRRIYPFKFLLKHYSFRSQKHGEKKVFRERKARWNPAERARGWHVHYDSMKQGHRFLQSLSDKEIFDEDHFNRTYLVERLSGIGAQRGRND